LYSLEEEDRTPRGEEWIDEARIVLREEPWEEGTTGELDEEGNDDGPSFSFREPGEPERSYD